MTFTVGWITRTISEMDRMNVGLAVVVVDDSAIQELKVSVNLA